MGPLVEVRNIRKSFSGSHGPFVLDDVTLSFPRGSFTVLLGRSGCGKTTLLRILSGLESPTSGEIEKSSENSKIGFVFQESRLMPWLTVSQNIKFLVDKVRDAEVEEILEFIGVGESSHLYPDQISTGMAQRVSLGRTLCYQSDIILMDEPFAALDYFTRIDLQEKVLQICKTLHKTVIFVTHSIEEAIFLGDRIVILQEGKIMEIFDNSFSHEQRRNLDGTSEFRRVILEKLDYRKVL